MTNLTATVVNSIRYRGRDGQWAWMLHRVTGLGVMMFLILHVVDIFLMTVGKETFEKFLSLYTAAPFRLLESALIFSVIYHALNGMRVIVIDFWPRTGRYQKVLWRIQLVLAILISIPAVFVTLRAIFEV